MQQARRIIWLVALIAAPIGALALVIGIAAAGSDVGIAAAAAVAVAIAGIPYCFARSFSAWSRTKEEPDA